MIEKLDEEVLVSYNYYPEGASRNNIDHHAMFRKINEHVEKLNELQASYNQIQANYGNVAESMTKVVTDEAGNSVAIL